MVGAGGRVRAHLLNDTGGMIDDEWIAKLRCPATGMPLRLASADEKRWRGIPADEPALVTEDGSRSYRAPAGMPVLLPPANDEVSSG